MVHSAQLLKNIPKYLQHEDGNFNFLERSNILSSYFKHRIHLEFEFLPCTFNSSVVPVTHSLTKLLLLAKFA